MMAKVRLVNRNGNSDQLLLLVGMTRHQTSREKTYLAPKLTCTAARFPSPFFTSSSGLNP